MIFVNSVYAQCPVCIVTVGGGMFLAQRLGVDDVLISILISALNTTIAFYLAPKLKYRLLANPWLLSSILLTTTLIYFQTSGQLYHAQNKLLGIDKIIFGQTVGMITVFIGNFIYGLTKYRNNGKALFPYAKVVFPVGLVPVLRNITQLRNFN